MSQFFDHRDIKWPGAWLLENEIVEAIPEIPFNRTMYVQQLTDEEPSDVEFVDDCQTLQSVFDRFQPETTVELKDEEEVGQDVKLQFRSMKDFGRDGIVEQSDLLSKIRDKKDLYNEFLEKLTDAQLNMLLSDPEEKAAYIEVLKGLITELEEADPEE